MIGTGPIAVVDTSIWVMLFRKDEADHRQVRAWIDLKVSAGETVAAPLIVLPEVAAALTRGVNRPLLAQRAVDFLASGKLIELHAVDPPLAQ